jgi:hypothetical protein
MTESNATGARTDAATSAAGAGPMKFPEPRVEMVFQLYAAQAMMSLGAIPAPGESKPAAPDFPAAKFAIDMLEVVQKKMDGNLDRDEAKMLEEMLAQLRMMFVEMKRRHDTK